MVYKIVHFNFFSIKKVYKIQQKEARCFSGPKRLFFATPASYQEVSFFTRQHFL